MKGMIFGQRRFKFFLVIAIIFAILQCIGVFYIVQIPSTKNLEFYYTESSHLTNGFGWYDGYTEDYYENGHYSVIFSGNVGQVQASVHWDFWAWDSGSLDNHTTRDVQYDFTYSLVDGHYINDSDQDYNATGEHIWFQVPGGFVKDNVTGNYMLSNGSDTITILNDKFSIGQNQGIWAGYLMPASAIILYSSGSLTHGADYDFLNASYSNTYYFTTEGHLFQSFYNEHTSGYSNGYWSGFDLKSETHVLGASWSRDFDAATYFWLYWSPIILLAFISFVLYPSFRWRSCKKLVHGVSYSIQKSIPTGKNIIIEGPYKDIMKAFISRTKHSRGSIFSAWHENQIEGIGLVEPDGSVGMFFGPEELVNAMLMYTGIKLVFSDHVIKNYKEVESYDIFLLNQIQNHTSIVDPEMIKPLTGAYIEPAMRMIAEEDHGKANARLVGWVKDALKTDIAFVATVSINDDWVREAVTRAKSRKMMPQIIGSEVIAGVGFMATSATQGWLYGLYVHPAFRNKGIGERLVHARLSALNQMGIFSAITEIAGWNAPSRKIYANLDAVQGEKMFMSAEKKTKLKMKVTRH